MLHSMPDHIALCSQWRTRPPTGRKMLAALSSSVPTEVLELSLARATGRSVECVRWHLDSDAVVPASFLVAALRMAERLTPR